MDKIYKELYNFTHKIYKNYKIVKIIDNLKNSNYQKSLSYIIKSNKKLYLIFYIDKIDPELLNIFGKYKSLEYYKKIYNYFNLKHYFFPKCISLHNNIFIFELSVKEINITDINYFLTKKCILQNMLLNTNKKIYNNIYNKLKHEISSIYYSKIIEPKQNLFINQVNVNSFCYDSDKLNFIDMNLVIPSTDKPTLIF
tara:strand:- start:1208 stop:1798 length:591 start_codon:yes stop_codon:yes gene_type:complete